ncbi:MAG: tetratricopeptide repeat protein [Actinomycetota bacterium]|nr:tetratricopeptide repeat protein [Actinomycetota bacterium]
MIADYYDRTDEARRRYREALDAGGTRALVEIGVVLARLGEADQAAELFRNGIETGDARGHLRLGSLLEAAGDTAGALSEYRQAVAEDVPVHGPSSGCSSPSEPASRRATTWPTARWELLCEHGRHEDAEEIFQTALRKATMTSGCRTGAASIR